MKALGGHLSINDFSALQVEHIPHCMGLRDNLGNRDICRKVSTMVELPVPKKKIKRENDPNFRKENNKCVNDLI